MSSSDTATVAIVSTHRRWTPESEAWARYHLSLGFTKLYVFADDGQVPPTPPGVVLTACTPAYWQSHPPTSRFDGYLRDIEGDLGSTRWGSPERVMQRQIVNACTALDQARADGIDWLLHIDDDEYFWCPGRSVHEHFTGLTRAGISLVLYFNHEAVLLEEGAADPARGLLFKKHEHALTRAHMEALPRILPGKPYFVSHKTGKSAARVTPDTLPDSVHYFKVPDPMAGFCPMLRPGILHQPYKSARQFCDKHLSQGVFSTEQVLGHAWTPPGVYEAAQQLCRDNDVEGLRALYARTVVLSEKEVELLEAGGFLLRPDVPLPISPASA